jgi:hypothetical protein
MRRAGGVEIARVDVEPDPRDSALGDLERRFEQPVDRRGGVERFERAEMRLRTPWLRA